MDKELLYGLLIVLAVVLIVSISAGSAMRKSARQQFADQQRYGWRRNIGQWGRDAEQDPYGWQTPPPRMSLAGKVIAGAAAVFVIAGILMAVMRVQNDGPAVPEPQNSAAPAETPSHSQPGSRPSRPPEGSVSSEEPVFTIDKMMFARHNGNLKYMEMAGAGLLNCCVYVTVENPTDRTVDLTEYETYLTCDGVRYEPFLSDDPAFLSAHPSVAPGGTLKLKVVDFQVPAEQQYANTAIEFTVRSPNGQETVWTLR